MAEIINLNRVRKARKRAETEARAQANRASHGRTKAERAHDEQANARDRRALDGHRLDDDPPPEQTD